MQGRISGNVAIILILLAICLDLGQAIIEWVTLGISNIWDSLIIDPAILVFFWLVFWKLGVNFTKTRALVFFGIALCEFIPAIQSFPLWTLDVIAVMAMTKAEDKLISKFGNSKAAQMMQNSKRLRGISRNIMGTLNKIPAAKQAIDKAQNASGNTKPTIDQNKTSGNTDTFTNMPQRQSNEPQNIPRNTKQKTLPREMDAREKKILEQKESKQRKKEKNTPDETPKEIQAGTPNENYEMRKRAKASFAGDFGRQDSGLSQSDRDRMLENQRRAKWERQISASKNLNPKNDTNDHQKAA